MDGTGPQNLLRAIKIGVLFCSIACMHASAPLASNAVTLTAVAFDRQGDPITGLQENEFRVIDAGRKPGILSFRAHEVRERQPVILFFDLLNARMSSRQMVKNEIVQSFRHVEATDQLYLYLLTQEGNVYPIRGLAEYEGPQRPENIPWTEAVGPMLDQALNRLLEVRPIDMQDLDFRTQATLRAFKELSAHVSELPGRKSIVWISHGVAIDYTYYDELYVALVQQLCTRLVQYDIAVYTVHESVEAGVYMSSADMLQQFADLTGGEALGTDQTGAAVAQAMKDDRVNYSITYQPANLVWNGKFHKVRVTCTRPGVRVRTIKGYYAIEPLRNAR